MGFVVRIVSLLVIAGNAASFLSAGRIVLAPSLTALNHI